MQTLCVEGNAVDFQTTLSVLHLGINIGSGIGLAKFSANNSKKVEFVSKLKFKSSDLEWHKFLELKHRK